MSQRSQITENWKKYASIKKWKKGLMYNSTRQKMSTKTEETIGNYVPLFLKYAQISSDIDLIQVDHLQYGE